MTVNIRDGGSARQPTNVSAAAHWLSRYRLLLAASFFVVSEQRAVSVKDVSSSPLSSPRGSSAAPISGPLAVRAVQSSASSPRFSQASPRTPRSNDVSPREPATPAERMARKLDQLTSELLQSERSYLKDVELLIQIYLEPLRRSAKSPRGAVDEEDVSDMLPQSDVNGVSGFLLCFESVFG